MNSHETKKKTEEIAASMWNRGETNSAIRAAVKGAFEIESRRTQAWAEGFCQDWLRKASGELMQAVVDHAGGLQSKAAALLGVDAATMSRHLSGVTVPPRPVLKLARLILKHKVTRC